MPPYTVQPGDTLSEIAQRFGTTVEAIARANAIPDVNVIIAGQTICVPIWISEPTRMLLYTVQPGDTLGAIAQRFGTTVEEVSRNNGIQNPDLIFAGQVLCVPSGPSMPLLDPPEPREYGSMPRSSPDGSLTLLTGVMETKIVTALTASAATLKGCPTTSWERCRLEPTIPCSMLSAPEPRLTSRASN